MKRLVAEVRRTSAKQGGRKKRKKEKKRRKGPYTVSRAWLADLGRGGGLVGGGGRNWWAGAECKRIWGGGGESYSGGPKQMPGWGFFFFSVSFAVPGAGSVMMEWLILCLLVPAVVVPVVLLWGFVGCNQFFGLDPTSLIETAFELDSEHNFTSPTAMNQSALEGSCFVVRIPKFLLTLGGPQVVITARGSTEGDLQIDRVYLSQAADSVDASRDPFDSLEADLTSVVDDGVGFLCAEG